jgi:Domain of unknown function (DUF6532)
MITVAQTFYGTPGSSYGIARYHATSKYFASLPAIVIIIACTQIYHAISEWTTGHRKTKKVDDQAIEGMLYVPLYFANKL